ncbi:MAG TPA: cyclophane-forming radical SAM/SPASM peptide maturase GrrM/OscB [Pyrinomonadaceae bacterium]|nr:cyclophane-forming radical SAM/SPASM peptide maturase GrrM/OscB [Pyrinomonadaceae bacterium]
MVTSDKISADKSFPFPPAGVGLLIVQPSPFCNINCDYCYLPERTSHKRMPTSVLKQSIERVIAAGLVGERLSIVWHAGEPLALPIAFYEEAFEAIASLPIAQGKITHSMQSNGMLINDEWCSFLRAHDIKLGLSIDGPAFIHDAHRKTRGGKGTHAQVMKGVEVLRRHQLDFHVIAVITEQALDFPDEIFQFFLDNGVRQVGFNIEELEGVNQTSTLTGDSKGQRVKDFFRRIYELQKESDGVVAVREFDRAYQAIAQGSVEDEPLSFPQNDQVVPFAIISVAYDGSISTFSPELLGLKSPEYGEFYFGNVMTDDLTGVAASLKFQHVLSDIQAGVRLCSETCEYFSFCGGGAPSNKYYENGSFASAETMFCNYTIKTPIDIVLEDLELSLGLSLPGVESQNIVSAVR